MIKTKLRVVTVCRDPETCNRCGKNKYGNECVLSNKEFPHLLEYLVEDDCGVFVVNPKNNDQFWPIMDFFGETKITSFLVNPEELDI